MRKSWIGAFIVLAVLSLNFAGCSLRGEVDVAGEAFGPTDAEPLSFVRPEAVYRNVNYDEYLSDGTYKGSVWYSFDSVGKLVTKEYHDKKTRAWTVEEVSYNTLNDIVAVSVYPYLRETKWYEKYRNGVWAIQYKFSYNNQRQLVAIAKYVSGNDKPLFRTKVSYENGMMKKVENTDVRNNRTFTSVINTFHYEDNANYDTCIQVDYSGKSYNNGKTTRFKYYYKEGNFNELIVTTPSGDDSLRYWLKWGYLLMLEEPNSDIVMKRGYSYGRAPGSTTEDWQIQTTFFKDTNYSIFDPTNGLNVFRHIHMLFLKDDDPFSGNW